MFFGPVLAPGCFFRRCVFCDGGDFGVAEGFLRQRAGFVATAWIHCATVGKRNVFTSVSFSLGCKGDFIVRSKGKSRM